ncbi:protein-disulfide isomerase [Rheinheimera sp. SA_1]|uniref:thiol:disulfide interchange protein DsbA/DsbL n=1 Tax=Rheinheimera sp. SA_1 TaxID=1827365 RepID=UPI000801B5E3|nr:thiol:disulfide interchange protein DsbA/DsbL [Rheinheimera sp. SA_1]OBP17218.1 protein-disulfide isomerase [Rheinheimera sp. SA_1]
MFYRTFISLLAALSLYACDANANKFVAGEHYEVVAEKSTSKPEIKEFFSFYCGHCFAFEPFAHKLSKNLPQGVELEKVHVDFLPAASPEMQAALSRAYVVGKNAGQGEQVAAMIFNYIHRQQATFTTDSDIRNLLLVNDFDAATFDKNFNSMPVLSAAAKMKEHQLFWSQNRVLTGVPTLLVNGKYKLKFDKLDPENFDAELKELVSYLLAKKD